MKFTAGEVYNELERCLEKSKTYEGVEYETHEKAGTKTFKIENSSRDLLGFYYYDTKMENFDIGMTLNDDDRILFQSSRKQPDVYSIYLSLGEGIGLMMKSKKNGKMKSTISFHDAAVDLEIDTCMAMVGLVDNDYIKEKLQSIAGKWPSLDFRFPDEAMYADQDAMLHYFDSLKKEYALFKKESKAKEMLLVPINFQDIIFKLMEREIAITYGDARGKLTLMLSFANGTFILETHKVLQKIVETVLVDT